MSPPTIPLLRRLPLQPIRLPNSRINARLRSSSGVKFTPAAAKPQQSLRLVAQTGQATADIGLLVDTFIMPTGKNLPSLFWSPSARLHLEGRRLKQRVMDLRDMMVFRFMAGFKLRLFEPRRVAVQLHRDMYNAFAAGDVDTLRLICSEGLLSSFRKRLAARGAERVTWRIHGMLRRPKVVSSKAHHYLGINVDRRQVVVRLHSLQSLARGDVEREPEPKEVLEYLVLEKKYDKGLEGPWTVWGTTEETTAGRLAEMEEQKARMGLS